MTHHHNEIRDASGDVIGQAVNPLDVESRRSSAGDLQHRASRIDPDDSTAASGEINCEHARGTADVDDGSCFELFGESEVEVVVVPPSTFGVVDRGKTRIFCPQP
jgi:hypothetical protein